MAPTVGGWPANQPMKLTGPASRLFEVQCRYSRAGKLSLSFGKPDAADRVVAAFWKGSIILSKLFVLLSAVVVLGLVPDLPAQPEDDKAAQAKMEGQQT